MKTIDESLKQKKRCIIEFWAEKGNLIKRSRFTISLYGENYKAYCKLPKKYIKLFEETAVYSYIYKEWRIAKIADYMNNIIAFDLIKFGEKPRLYFKKGA